MKIIPKGIIEKCTRTVGDRSEIDEVMRAILITQRAVGNQILDPYWSWMKSLPHQLVLGAFMFYVLIGTWEFVGGTDDVKLIAEGSFTYIVAALIPSRYYFFLMARKDFQKLYIAFKTTVCKFITDDSEEKMEQLLKKTRSLVKFMLFSSNFPMAIYFLAAMWHYVQGEKRTISKTTSILMPMRSPYHEIGLFAHSFFIFEAGFLILVPDMWFVVIMLFFCSACDSAAKFLIVEERRNESKLQYATRLNDSLRKFYVAHVKLIDFLDVLNSVFKWLALLPLISVGVGICIILLLITQGVDWAFLSNILPVMGELFVYNWFGEQIINKAEKWSLALLNFDWINLSAKDKKCYYIMVSYMQKKFRMKTAIGSEFSLLTMSTCVKGGYQAFTVLQSATHKRE
uniref:Odorant receptor n=1 Tax=Ostrinia furnacalis TaxID=93504 RepID=A0A0E4B3W2_OSTFU|nr:putative olfactory receptor 32 [Ostrinia furnacalis]